MTATVRVAVAVVTDEEPRLVAALAGEPGLEVVRRCADLPELLSCTAAGLADAVLVSATLRGLDAETLDRLRVDGAGCVVLVDPSDGQVRSRFSRVGGCTVMDDDSTAPEIAGALARSRPRPAPVRTPWGANPAQEDGSTDRVEDADTAIGLSQPRAALARPVQAAPPSPSPPAGPGRVVTVWGPTGAPGRTTLAIGLAAELAGGGAATLLVDADTYGASVAQSLGLLDESSGLAAAARAADRGELDLVALARFAPLVGERLRVLTGTTRADRWPELRAGAVERVLRQARSLARWTVVDVGFCLERDEELVYDTAAPRRNGATLAALAEADEVVAVGSADPVGLQRLVRGLGELAELRADPPVVVVNRLRPGAVGANPGRRVRDALRRYAGVNQPVLVAHDQASLDAAMLAGRTLAEHARASPVRHALQDLVLRLDAGTAVGQGTGRATRAPEPTMSR